MKKYHMSVQILICAQSRTDVVFDQNVHNADYCNSVCFQVILLSLTGSQFATVAFPLKLGHTVDPY